MNVSVDEAGSDERSLQINLPGGAVPLAQPGDAAFAQGQIDRLNLAAEDVYNPTAREQHVGRNISASDGQ
jgi:hypothetical protein